MGHASNIAYVFINRRMAVKGGACARKKAYYTRKKNARERERKGSEKNTER